MKKLFSMLFLLAAVSTAYAQNAVSNVARFNTEAIQLGKLQQNVPATATFIVTNKGRKPLLIEKALPSCGCTASEYTRTAIAPGKTGTIKATYNAATPGMFNKTINVKFAEIADMTALSISGEVEAAKQ